MQVLLHLITQLVFQSRSQYRHFGIFAQRVVRCRTPNHINVGIQLVEKVVNLLQFTHIDGVLVTRIDIEQYTLGLADVVTIQQRRVQRIQYSPLHTMLTTGTSHRHDGPTAILHRCLHIAEVTLDPPVARHRYQFRNTLHRIHQDVVSPLESLFDRQLRVSIHIAQTLVVHYQQRIHILP